MSQLFTNAPHQQFDSILSDPWGWFPSRKVSSYQPFSSNPAVACAGSPPGTSLANREFSTCHGARSIFVSADVMAFVMVKQGEKFIRMPLSICSKMSGESWDCPVRLLSLYQIYLIIKMSSFCKFSMNASKLPSAWSRWGVVLTPKHSDTQTRISFDKNDKIMHCRTMI